MKRYLNAFFVLSLPYLADFILCTFLCFYHSPKERKEEGTNAWPDWNRLPSLQRFRCVLSCVCSLYLLITYPLTPTDALYLNPSLESKLKGSTYFPTSISGIYNATMIIQQRHFPVCPSVSTETLCTYNKLKGLTARSASTKDYWISAAKKLGLVDTSKGVFFRSSELPTSQEISKPRAVQRTEPLVRLVEAGDKNFATDYAFYVMEQMTTCVFTEADRLGKRKCHKVGFPGLACRHCYGGNGSGRFFPLTLKTFSDVSKSIHVLRNHLVKCTKAPNGMAETVNMLFERHKQEKVSSSNYVFCLYR